MIVEWCAAGKILSAALRFAVGEYPKNPPNIGSGLYQEKAHVMHINIAVPGI